MIKTIDDVIPYTVLLLFAANHIINKTYHTELNNKLETRKNKKGGGAGQHPWACKPTYWASKPTYWACKPTYWASKPTYWACKPLLSRTVTCSV